MELKEIFHEGIPGLVNDYIKEFNGVPYANLNIEDENIKKIIPISKDIIIVLSYSKTLIWEVSKNRLLDLPLKLEGSFLLLNELIFFDDSGNIMIYNVGNEITPEKSFYVEDAMTVEKLNEEIFLSLTDSVINIHDFNGNILKQILLPDLIEVEFIGNGLMFHIVDDTQIIFYGKEKETEKNYHFFLINLEQGKIINTIKFETEDFFIVNIFTVSGNSVAITILETTYIWETTLNEILSLNGIIIQSYENHLVLKDRDLDGSIHYKIYEFTSQSYDLIGLDIPPFLIRNNKLLLIYEDRVEKLNLTNGVIEDTIPQIFDFQSLIYGYRLKLFHNGDILERRENEIVIHR